jgi:hypothetical protein
MRIKRERTHSSQYDANFYVEQSSDSFESAKSVLPIVFNLIGTPSSIIDVGAGIGAWSSVSKELGVSEVVCLEGNWIENVETLVPRNNYKILDLNQPFSDSTDYELVICIEVAEHLDKERARGFISDITKLSNTILFSAAVPGQGGTDHRNEAKLSYWSELFKENGFYLYDKIRPEIWNLETIAPWYRQNLVIFSKLDKINLADSKSVIDIIHPSMFESMSISNFSSVDLLKIVAGRIKSKMKRGS